MTCNGCNKRATHLVERVPHCQEHMLESLCSVPVAVIDIEAYEHAQKQVIREMRESA